MFNETEHVIRMDSIHFFNPKLEDWQLEEAADSIENIPTTINYIL